MLCPHIGEARLHVWPGRDALGRGAQYGGHYVEPCCTLSSPLLVMLGSVALDPHDLVRTQSLQKVSNVFLEDFK